VIGLTGLMRAGKDSVADILVRDHGFVKMSFAAPLKRMVKNLDPIVGFEPSGCAECDYEDCLANELQPVYLQDLYDAGMTDEEIKASQYGDEARRLWQRFGTDVMRAEQDDYWIQKAKDDLLASGHERVVFTDCRFPNEAEMIYRLRDMVVGKSYQDADNIQASVWQIVRPGVERQEGAHASEQNVGLMGEEITIHNDGTLEELAEPVGTALRVVTGEDLPDYGWVHALFGDPVEELG
jgi:hypothetical protein